MVHFHIAFSTVFPIFLFLIIGAFFRRANLMNDAFLVEFNRLLFHAFLPAALFCNITNTSIQQMPSTRLILFAIGSTFILFLILMLIVPRFEKINARRGVIIQGIIRSNFLLMGLPMIQYLYGQEGLGTVSFMIAIVVPLYNGIAVFILERYRSTSFHPARIIRELAHNPLILAALFAVALKLLSIQIPTTVLSVIQDLADAASPLALIVLGSSFHFSDITGNQHWLFICSAVKLIIFPTVVLSIAILVGFRGVELATLLIMSAAPTAVSTFSMAQQLDADSVLASHIIIATTIVSIFTLFLWIALLKYLALI